MGREASKKGMWITEGVRKELQGGYIGLFIAIITKCNGAADDDDFNQSSASASLTSLRLAFIIKVDYAYSNFSGLMSCAGPKTFWV